MPVIIGTFLSSRLSGWFDLGILATPAVQFAVRKYYDGGVMINRHPTQPTKVQRNKVRLTNME